MKLSLALVASVALVAYASAYYALPTKKKNYWLHYAVVGLIHMSDAAYKPVKGGTYNTFTVAKLRANAAVKLAANEGLNGCLAASRNYEYKTKNFMVNPFGTCQQQGTAKKGEKKHMIFHHRNFGNCYSAFEGSIQAEDWMADALIIPCIVRTGCNKFSGLTGLGAWYYEKAHRTTANVTGATCAYTIHDSKKAGYKVEGSRWNHQKSYAALVSYVVGVRVGDQKCGGYLQTVGHSLGGHIASVALQRSLNRDMNYKTSATFPGVYVQSGTVGQPRAWMGVEYWTNWLRCMKFNEEHFRMVNYRDIVPTLPPKAFHLHTGKKIHIYPGFRCQNKTFSVLGLSAPAATSAYPFASSSTKKTWAKNAKFFQLWKAQDDDDDNPPIDIDSAISGEAMYLALFKFIVLYVETGSADFTLIGKAVKSTFADYCDLGTIFKFIFDFLTKEKKSSASNSTSNSKGVSTKALSSSQNSKVKSKRAKWFDKADKVCKKIGPFTIATWTWWLTGVASHFGGISKKYATAARAGCPNQMEQKCSSYHWARMYWRSKSKKSLYKCMNKRCKMTSCASYPQYKYHSISGGRMFTSSNT